MFRAMICLAAAGLMTGCAPSPSAQNGGETPSANETTTTLTVSTAKEFVARFDGNATTGYIWSYKMAEEGIVRETKNRYLTDNSRVLCGAPGVFEFTFVGVKPGAVDLNFAYARPWEKTTEPITTKTLRLKVAEDLSVSEEK
ncbi:protease inhibitor I42 family protein [Candidatus Sumerlaeota bacterium]|nr:protease inhibitor I42 family protein [Candidatus Sumerlaeales bacterium]NLD60828.1 protease inhibitor I42 family protein [Candidatus Sumerlaeota bacterium]